MPFRGTWVDPTFILLGSCFWFVSFLYTVLWIFIRLSFFFLPLFFLFFFILWLLITHLISLIPFLSVPVSQCREDVFDPRLDLTKVKDYEICIYLIYLYCLHVVCCFSSLKLLQISSAWWSSTSRHLHQVVIEFWNSWISESIKILIWRNSII